MELAWVGLFSKDMLWLVISSTAWVHVKPSTRSTLRMALRQERSFRSKDLRSGDWKHGVVLSKCSTLGMAMEWRNRVMASCLQKWLSLAPIVFKACILLAREVSLANGWSQDDSLFRGDFGTGWGQHPGSSCQFAWHRSDLSCCGSNEVPDIPLRVQWTEGLVGPPFQGHLKCYHPGKWCEAPPSTEVPMGVSQDWTVMGPRGPLAEYPQKTVWWSLGREGLKVWNSMQNEWENFRYHISCSWASWVDFHLWPGF